MGSQPNAPSSEQVRALLDLLHTYLSIYDSYHNQKETVAFAFTVFYLGGASALLSSDKMFWKNYSHPMFVCFLILVGVAGGLSTIFVWYLFGLRRDAGDIYQACNIVVTNWSIKPPSALSEIQCSTKLRCKKYGRLVRNFEWPSALADKIEELHQKRTRYWKPREITLAAILLWTAAVFVRIW